MAPDAQSEIARFAARQDVCPWGKGAAAHGRVQAHVLLPGLVGEISLRKAVREFGSSTGGTAFVLVCSHERALSFERFEEVAEAGYVALRKAVLRTYHMDRSRQEREQLLSHELRQMVDPTCPIRPHMLLGGLPVTVTAMGPIYSAHHPRFSPLPIVCAVWTDDLRAIPIPAKAPHRERMARLAGAPYDADAFVLPLGSAGHTHRRGLPHAG